MIDFTIDKWAEPYYLETRSYLKEWGENDTQSSLAQPPKAQPSNLILKLLERATKSQE